MWAAGLDQNITTGLKLVKCQQFFGPGLHILNQHQIYNFQAVWTSVSSTGIARSGTSLVKAKYNVKRQDEREKNNFSRLSYYNVVENSNGISDFRNYPMQLWFREVTENFGCILLQKRVSCVMEKPMSPLSSPYGVFTSEVVDSQMENTN